MELKLEEFVRDINKYKASIAVEKIEKEQKS